MRPLTNLPRTTLPVRVIPTAGYSLARRVRASVRAPPRGGPDAWARRPRPAPASVKLEFHYHYRVTPPDHHKFFCTPEITNTRIYPPRSQH